MKPEKNSYYTVRVDAQTDALFYMTPCSEGVRVATVHKHGPTLVDMTIDFGVPTVTLSMVKRIGELYGAQYKLNPKV